MLKSIDNKGQTCCSPGEEKAYSVFLRLPHFSRSRIYKSRMALHMLLGFNLPSAPFLLTWSWWLQCICQLAFLENNGQEMKFLKTSLWNSLFANKMFTSISVAGANGNPPWDVLCYTKWELKYYEQPRNRKFTWRGAQADDWIKYLRNRKGNMALVS